ncbi:MAG: SsrA-binding protein SmpB [Actinomycetota bacterium]
MVEQKVVARNKKAYHDYFIEETYEAGIVLEGAEVKSLRAGKVSMRESFARIKNGEVFLYNMHISPYEHGDVLKPEPRRTRKLLLHKSEIRRLIGKTEERGYTLIPLNVYFSCGFAKVELGLARGKHLYDKRRKIAEKTARREIERALKERQKSHR